MTDTTLFVIIALLGLVVVALFVYSSRQKRRFEAERAERRRKLDEIKAKARAQEAAED
ncbi:hypothetical protein ACFFUB_07175 [Algimonas porphyrae]|uniref:Uncharacterized protein n=1 Tax=Algimonas porphyrae TaxID=1128113 RepID=A0ABQ5V2H3_9PROT|nr:hypothetical protein [Algimonas porphyrae]GLQ21053.1 hypothetical protein GCM10007854_20080 [Algimonas porphyrae]